MNVSAIVLSAGESSRMGTPKAFLSGVSSKPFIVSQIETYRNFGCNEVIIVVNEKVMQYAVKNNISCFSDVIIITNNKLELGRFYSLKLGINSISNVDFCFVHNVDNPLIDIGLLKEIHHLRNSADLIAPRKDSKNGHPILVNKKIISRIKQENSSKLKMNEFLATFNKKLVEVKYDSIHYNINTQGDYLKYLNRVNK